MKVRLQAAKEACIIFVLALAARIGLNILFFTRFGPHTAVEKEIWYYYGILNNTFHICRLDPTYWILQPLKFLPHEAWFYGVVFIAALLSSLTAVLVFLFGTRLFGARLGFWAGMIYAFLAGPLGMSIANFTHDLAQLPIIITLFLVTLSIIENRGFKRLIYIAVFLILAYIGLEVGPLIIAALFISLLYMLFTLFKRANRLFIFCLVLLFVFLVRFIFLNSVLQFFNHFSLTLRGIDLLSQVKAHARDLMPIAAKGLFLRIGAWSILVLLGMVFNYRKMEPFSLIIFSVGVIFSFSFARVVRLVDIGAALMAGYAFSYPWLKKRPSLVILIFGILTALFCYNNLRPASTEAEYQTFLWLKEHSQKQDRVLIPWASGYFLKSVSAREPTSSPEHIDFSLHRLYWEPIGQAYRILKDKHIKFVHVSNRYFGVVF